jgi:hypothetical protein
MFWATTVLATGLCAGTFYFLLPEHIAPKTMDLDFRTGYIALRQSFPWIIDVALGGLPVLGVGAAAIVALRGTYLAQQFACFFAPATILSIYGIGKSLGIEISPIIWVLGPIAGSAFAFFMGLRSAKVLPPEDPNEKSEVEYRPVDAWDREAKARHKARYLDVGAAYRRLLLGIGVAIGVQWLFPALLKTLLLMKAGTPPDIERYFWSLNMLAVGFGAVIAGAGTRQGWLNGLITGFVMLYLTKAWLTFDLVKMVMRHDAWQYLGSGFVGGILGAWLLGPSMIVKGKVLTPADEFRYLNSDEQAIEDAKEAAKAAKAAAR